VALKDARPPSLWFFTDYRGNRPALPRGCLRRPLFVKDASRRWRGGLKAVLDKKHPPKALGIQAGPEKWPLSGLPKK